MTNAHSSIPRTTLVLGITVLVALTLWPAEATAARGQALRELVERVLRQGGREAGQTLIEQTTRRLNQQTSRHGDDVVRAFERVGESSLRIGESAGRHAPAAYRTMARHGPSGAAVARNSDQLALVSRYGDDAANALVRHPGMAESVIRQYGTEGARAVGNLSSRQARRLAHMVNQGSVPSGAQGARLMRVLSKYGDPAMDFVWRHKGALLVGGGLAVFLSDPGSVLGSDGPLGPGGPGGVIVDSIARSINWSVILTPVLGFLMLLVAIRYRLWRWLRPAQRQRKDADADGPDPTSAPSPQADAGARPRGMNTADSSATSAGPRPHGQDVQSATSPHLHATTPTVDQDGNAILESDGNPHRSAALGVATARSHDPTLATGGAAGPAGS